MNWRRNLHPFVLFVLLAVPGCFGEEDPPCPHPKEPSRTPERVSIQQGIWGNVWFWSGDFMPMCESGTITPVVREMLVYEMTPWDSVTTVPGRGGFFSEVKTQLVATIQSDVAGFFEVSLPVGQYSMFVREDSLFYANRFDGQGNIWPMAVSSNTVSEARFDINYEASW